jgi:hypothetical protein
MRQRFGSDFRRGACFMNTRDPECRLRVGIRNPQNRCCTRSYARTHFEETCREYVENVPEEGRDGSYSIGSACAVREVSSEAVAQPIGATG